MAIPVMDGGARVLLLVFLVLSAATLPGSASAVRRRALRRRVCFRAVARPAASRSRRDGVGQDRRGGVLGGAAQGERPEPHVRHRVPRAPLRDHDGRSGTRSHLREGRGR